MSDEGLLGFILIRALALRRKKDALARRVPALLSRARSETKTS